MDTAAGNRGVIAGGWSFQYDQTLFLSSQQTSVRLPASGTGPGAAAAYPLTFDVSTALPTATVQSLNMRLFLQHSFPDDLRIVLQSPSGTAVILMANAGGGTPVDFAGFFGDDGVFVPDDGPINGAGVYRPGSVYGRSSTRPTPCRSRPSAP